MTPLLRARGLRRSFAPRRPGEARVVAVDDVDLDLYPGEVVGLVGESGSGKTTLGKLLLRILEPEAGTLEFEGQDLRALKPRELRRLRSRMQMIHQGATACLNPGLSVEQHLRESVELHLPERKAEAGALVAAWLGIFGLQGKERSRPGELSGGERRRVGVARCLIPDPHLVVADEPTAGLDASVKAEVLRHVLHGERGHRAWLFISHELDLVRSVADRVLVMHRGRIVQELPAEALAAGSGARLHPYTEHLLGAGFGAWPRLPAARNPAPQGAACAWAASCARVAPEDPLWSSCTRIDPPRVQPGGPTTIACHRHPEAAPCPSES